MYKRQGRDGQPLGDALYDAHQHRFDDLDKQNAFLLVSSLLDGATGYLIIYNIFYISVVQDIRFYGLLKTVGTTKKQIRAIIRRQALVLSIVGIPIGLAAGYGVSELLFPFVMEITSYTDLGISLKIRPQVAVFGIVFALLTVFISCRKPGKIAGSVSPVEAVRYTEGKGSRKKRKKSEKGARIHRTVSYTHLDVYKRQAQGIQIEIGTEKVSDNQDSLRKYLVASVRDYGSGFSDQALIYGSEPFFSGDDSRHDRKHQGLGLSIADTFMKKQGGFLKYGNSVEGDGAEVSLWIKIADEKIN